VNAPQAEPEPIGLAWDVAITFVPWDGGLAATLNLGTLSVTLAEDVTGDLSLIDWGDGDIRVEVADEVDYLSKAARLIADLGRADEEWASPDRSHWWIRIEQWVLTIADPTAVDHVCCPSPVDAQALFADWVSDDVASF
jgi:hypothetical protein